MIDAAEVTKACQARLVKRGQVDAFSGVSIDTRTLTEGALFFAIVGEHHDGHAFIEQAVAAGARGVVVSKPVSVESPITVFEVDDTTAALGRLAAAVRQRLNPTVIAVTGSAGKTTTKELTAHLLSQRFAVVKSPASFNNQYGVPLTLLSLDPVHTHAVVEIGVNHIGELKPLAEIARPNVGIVTNVGYAHIEYFGSREAILEEKIQLLLHLEKGGTAVVNGDDDLLMSKVPLLEERGYSVISAGLGERNTIRAEVSEGPLSFISGFVHGPSWKYPFTLRAVGEHFVQSAMLAVAAAIHSGLPAQAAVEGLESFTPPAGRMNLLQVSATVHVIDDTYNASPDAMLAAVRTLGRLPIARRIAVLGEMREIGSFTKFCHEMVGEAVAGAATDFITVGEAARFMQEGALRAGFDPSRMRTAESALDALEQVRTILAESDEQTIVLVKGARFTHMERVVLGLEGATVGCRRSPCTLYIHCRDCPLLETGEDRRTGKDPFPYPSKPFGDDDSLEPRGPHRHASDAVGGPRSKRPCR
ncbi:MAG TPA: UDP-N-acetylmuramoyl-tripeptide--D-alanyl-D-alanine ligase [Candidatus Baltobacteraceae bacterium]|jgi:UDP-N-acetylmuramoyl-tripeptide--D-alanyl-D-alanine ligase|nr:UDP-N-acetylmuramoyl-tripeptide--D-alanyl-D-alanine ligase [Candidatus Baltobacteraceae bacterium]